MFAAVLIAGVVGLAQAETPGADPATKAITAAVRAHVAATARVKVRDVEVRWLGLGTKVDCTGVPNVIVDTRPGEDFRGRTELRVTLTSGGKECGRLRLPARIAIWRDVQMAAAAAAPGERVKLKSGRAPRDTFRGDAIDPKAGAWIALHALLPGETVTDGDVILAPAVKAGDRVVLETVIGALRIKADAHMLNDARIGERVRVANIATGTVVSGVLVNARTVRVGGRP